MATFKAEIQNKRNDGTYNVRIRIIHKGEVRRLSTPFYVSQEYVTNGKKIKDAQILDKCEDIIRICRQRSVELGYRIEEMSISELITDIQDILSGGGRFKLDFFEYADTVIAQMKESTGKTYINAFDSLKRFIGRDFLDISEINLQFLRRYEMFIESEPSQRGAVHSKDESKLPVRSKGGRAVSKYLACIRAVHNRAKLEYNDDDRGIVKIPYSPFKNFKLKAQPITRKRALAVEVIQSIIDLPYVEEKNSTRWNSFNLAKDCFIMSLCLVGMNSADMYYCNASKDGVITYNRRKTASRRDDNAEMRVKVEPILRSFVNKYKGSGNMMFNFNEHYKSHEVFNCALNDGLKAIGERLEIEGLTFYSARHSWATLARSSSVNIDKYTVHEALNHSSSEMRITDIYIERDWSVIWAANAKVIQLFDWSSVLLG